MTKGEINALYSLTDDTSIIIIKEADKGLGVVVGIERTTCQKQKNNLMIRKLRSRGDVSHETLDYFSINNPRLGRFYLLPKINKWLHDVPGRHSHSGCYIANISFFIEYYLKPLAQNVKSYIKDTNDFLCKLASFPPLPDDVTLCHCTKNDALY